jgi:hypothetical protein
VLQSGDHALRRRVVQLDTPHVSRNWRRRSSSRKPDLFTGDLGTQVGDPPATTDVDIVDAVIEAEERVPSDVVADRLCHDDAPSGQACSPDFGDHAWGVVRGRWCDDARALGRSLRAAVR